MTDEQLSVKREQYYEDNKEAIKSAWLDTHELADSISKVIDKFIRSKTQYTGNEKFSIIARALHQTHSRYCDINYNEDIK